MVRFGAAREERFKGADYRRIHGHCNVPKRDSETSSWELVGTKEQLQVAPRRKEIADDRLANSGIGKLGFRMGTVAAWDGRLKELADYRKSTGTAMFLQSAAESIAVGLEPKGKQLLHQMERHRIMTHLYESRHWKACSEWTAQAPPGRPFKRA
jgi:hypothetical protein